MYGVLNVCSFEHSSLVLAEVGDAELKVGVTTDFAGLFLEAWDRLIVSQVILSYHLGFGFLLF